MIWIVSDVTVHVVVNRNNVLDCFLCNRVCSRQSEQCVGLFMMYTCSLAINAHIVHMLLTMNFLYPK